MKKTHARQRYLSPEQARRQASMLSNWRAMIAFVQSEKRCTRDMLLASFPKSAADIDAVIENGLLREVDGNLALSAAGESFVSLVHDRRATQKASHVMRLLH